MAATRKARSGVLIAGGGFAGGYVARLLGRAGATIVSPENFMLYTPLLPEAASGTLEPRHVVVPLRQMCPHAELLLGHVRALDEERRVVSVETAGAGSFELSYEHLVLALGSVARTLPVPGLAEHAVGFKDLADAIHLRNRVLGQLEAAAAQLDDAEAANHLTFVFVGAGYAGVEALAELSDLVADALRFYPRLAHVRQRWVLVDAAPKILPEIPPAARRLCGARADAARGRDLRRDDARIRRPRRGRALERAPDPHAHARVDGGREGSPAPRRARTAARRARSSRRRRVPPRRRARSPLGARRRGGGAEPVHAGTRRPAHLPARPSAGTAAREEPPGTPRALQLQDARPSRDARTLIAGSRTCSACA